MLVANTDFLLPTATIIPEAITFLILLAIVARYVVPRINQAMDKRRSQIAQSLEVIEVARATEEESRSRAEATLASAQHQARALIDAATKAGEEIRQEMARRAREEYERTLARAQSELARERQQAADELRRQVADLVVVATQAVIGRQLGPESHRELIDAAIGEVEGGVKERFRGYAAAALGGAGDQLGRIAAELGTLLAAVFASESLYDAIVDTALSVEVRQDIVLDLLGNAHPLTRRLVAELVRVERDAEVPPVLEWLETRARDLAESSSPWPLPEPPTSKGIAKTRLEGFATAVFEDLRDLEAVEAMEDELFRLARTLEAHPQLEAVLTDASVAVPARQRLAADLLEGKARPETARLVAFTQAATRARELVELLDWLVERVAAERGLRVAEVTAAVDLDQDQRERLAAALSRRTGRPVELRVRVEPELIGGMSVVIGDTVIDGTVRHRLERLRLALSAGAPTGIDSGGDA